MTNKQTISLIAVLVALFLIFGGEDQPETLSAAADLPANGEPLIVGFDPPVTERSGNQIFVDPPADVERRDDTPKPSTLFSGSSGTASSQFKTRDPEPRRMEGRNVYFANCSAARAAGAAPVYRGDPGYASRLDRDNDGIGCE